jgi:hypothetical protein
MYTRYEIIEDKQFNYTQYVVVKFTTPNGKGHVMGRYFVKENAKKLIEELQSA